MENSLLNVLLFFRSLIDNFLKGRRVGLDVKPTNRIIVNQRSLNRLENLILSTLKDRQLTLEEIKEEVTGSFDTLKAVRELIRKGWVFCNRDKYSYVRDDEAVIFISRKCNEIIREVRPMNNRDLSESLLSESINISKRGVNRILFSNLNRGLVNGPNHNPDDPLWF